MQERSAEWLRGYAYGLEAHSLTGRSAHLKQVRAELAAAEAREGGEKKDVPETNFGDMPTAAEVIEAAEKALAHWKSHVSMPTGPTANYGAILESLAVAKIETDAALVLCARWKEARNAGK